MSFARLIPLRSQPIKQIGVRRENGLRDLFYAPGL